MPDDEKVTEQDETTEKEEGEVSVDEEAEAAFGEDDETDDPDTEADASAASMGGKTEKSEKETSAEKEAAEKKAEEDKNPFQDDLNERLKTVEDEFGDVDVAEKAEIEAAVKKVTKSEEKTAEKEKSANEKEDNVSFTREDIGNRLDLLSIDDLPDAVTVGDRTVDLKGYAKEFPDEFAAIIVTASIIAEKQGKKAGTPKAKEFDSSEIEKRIGGLEVSTNQLSFDGAVARAKDGDGKLIHPDYYDIIYGEGNEDFLAWVAVQEPKVKKLLNTYNVKDGILMLNYYKKGIAKDKVAAHDKKSKKEKDKMGDIHKSTTRSDKTLSRKSGGGKFESEAAEAEASFDEDD